MKQFLINFLLANLFGSLIGCYTYWYAFNKGTIEGQHDHQIEVLILKNDIYERAYDKGREEGIKIGETKKYIHDSVKKLLEQAIQEAYEEGYWKGIERGRMES